MSKVPLLDLTRASPDLTRELHEAFARVLASGRYILGPEVDAFERECGAYVGARHAIGVSSGTDALLAALMVLGVGPGDEVVCPTFTFFATAGAIHRTGARPVLVDCAPSGFDATAPQIAEKIGPRTRAIVPVHLFGKCADTPAIVDAARGVPVIEDAAQALGATHRGRAAGTMGAVGCFSFFPSKNLGGFGDGGLCTTDDDALADKLRAARVHGAAPKYHHAFVGGNFRLDALQAALLRPKLRRLDAFTERRRENAALYARLLGEAGIAAPDRGGERTDAPVLLPDVGDAASRHIVNQYVLRVPEGRRDALRAHLREHGVETEVYYPIPLHLQPCFAGLGHRPGDFPNAERAAAEALALPIFPELTADEIGYVAEQIARFFRGVWRPGATQGT